MLGLLDVPEVMCCVLLRMLEAMEGVLCLLEILEVPEVMNCVRYRRARGIERRRCAAGVQTWRYGVRELWRRAAGVLPLRGMELGRCAAGV